MTTNPMVAVHPETHTLAHFNPSELHTMVGLQGGPQYAQDGQLAFNNLDHALHHPAMIPHMANAIQQAHAYAGGGMVNHFHNDPEQAIADQGLHGDHNVAWVPHRLSHLFDQAIGRPGGDINPNTGLKQYWSLGGILDSAKKAVSNPMSTLKNVVQSDTFKNLAGQGAQMGLGMLANKLGNTNTGNGLGNFAAQAAGHLASHAADTIGANGLNRDALMQAGRQGLGNIVQQGMNQGLSHLTGEAPIGPNVLTNAHLNMPTDNTSIAQKLGAMGAGVGSNLAGHAIGALNQHAGNLLGQEAYAPLGAAIHHAGTNYAANLGNQVGSHVGGIADQGLNAVKQRFAEHGGSMHPGLPAPMSAGTAPQMHYERNNYAFGGMTAPQQAPMSAPMYGRPARQWQPPQNNMDQSSGQAPAMGAPSSFPQRPNGHPTGQLSNMLMDHQAKQGMYGYGMQ